MSREFRISKQAFGWYVGTMDGPYLYVLCDGTIASAGEEIAQDAPRSVWHSTEEAAERVLLIARLRGDAL